MMNYDKVIAFLERENPDAEVVSRFKQAYQTFSETGEWHPTYQVLTTGWQKLDGILLELYTTKLSLPTAIVVGNENTGITTETRECCTELVRIPMASGQSSLNVGVAAGVLLYELARQHRI